jgi:signal peptidase I
MLRKCGRHLIRSRYVCNGLQARGVSRHESTSSRLPSSDDTAVASSDDWQWIPSLCARLLAAFGMAHVVSEYGVELTLCEGPSMLPTIRPSGEIILVDRCTIRLFGIEGGCDGNERVQQARRRQEEYEKASRQSSWYQVIIPANQFSPHGKWGRFWTRLTTGISVGDVVVVQHPERRGTVCKRVLGLPGDVVLRSPTRIMRRASNDPPTRKILYIVPDGHVWIEGDNSLNSSDSRVYGAIPAALIVGRVICRVWPLRGDALMERGARPTISPGRPCSGSTILPAGYNGEEISRFDSSRR